MDVLNMAADEAFWESFWSELHKLREQSLPSGMRLDELLAIAAFYPISERQQEDPPLVDVRNLIRNLRLGDTKQAVMDAFRRYEAARLVMHQDARRYTMDSRVRVYLQEGWCSLVSQSTIGYLWNHAELVIYHMRSETFKAIRFEVESLKRELGIVKPTPEPDNLMNYQASLREMAKRR